MPDDETEPAPFRHENRLSAYLTRSQAAELARGSDTPAPDEPGTAKAGTGAMDVPFAEGDRASGDPESDQSDHPADAPAALDDQVSADDELSPPLETDLPEDGIVPGMPAPPPVPAKIKEDPASGEQMSEDRPHPTRERPEPANAAQPSTQSGGDSRANSPIDPASDAPRLVRNAPAADGKAASLKESPSNLGDTASRSESATGIRLSGSISDHRVSTTRPAVTVLDRGAASLTSMSQLSRTATASVSDPAGQVEAANSPRSAAAAEMASQNSRPSGNTSDTDGQQTEPLVADHDGDDGPIDDNRASPTRPAAALLDRPAHGFSPMPHLSTTATALLSDLAHRVETVTAAANPNASIGEPTATRMADSLRIQLNPIHLGTVTANLRVEDGQLSVEIVVENDAALRQLTSDRETIEHSLRALGLDLGEVRISQSQPSANSQQANTSGQRDGQGQQQFAQQQNAGDSSGGERRQNESGNGFGSTPGDNGANRQVQTGGGDPRAGRFI